MRRFFNLWTRREAVLAGLRARLREMARQVGFWLAARAGRLRQWQLPGGRELVRAVGVAVAAFIVVNVVGEVVRGPFDTLGDWISWPHAPSLRRGLGLALAGVLLVNALVRKRPVWALWGATSVFASVASVAALDVVRFASVVMRGRVVTPALVPASAFVVLLFAALAWETAIAQAGEPVRRSFLAGRPEGTTHGGIPGEAQRSGRRDWLVRLAVAGLTFVAIPLVQMFTFGPSRYERTADCAVVFGARVWSSGRPSDALADRVDEAVRLYQRGLVSRLVMSGSVDADIGFSEPEVMAARAEARGVPRQAIFLDEEGVDTASTVRNTARLMREEGMSRALVVTHYYHEPRAKMLFDRAGVRAFTVPAHMSRRLRKEPYFLVREIAAYYHSFLME